MDDDYEAKIKGVLEISKGILNFADSVVLNCAVELRIPDIIHSHGRPITLSQIASSIDSPHPVNIAYLQRVMRLLVCLKIFTIQLSDDGENSAVYGLTHASMALLRDAEITYAPIVLMANHPVMWSSCHYLTECVIGGGSGMKKAVGVELFEYMSSDPEMSRVFNEGMRCSARIFAKMIVSTYRDGFDSIGSFVDVGGGVGELAAEIVKAFPHVRGFSFDLPHVVATASDYDGLITHVAGDMFVSVPEADAIIMMHILHDWGDEDCVKILKNCREAIAKKKGKVVIVDIVMMGSSSSSSTNNNNDNEVFEKGDLVMDLIMMLHCQGGKERTQFQWNTLLQQAGFSTFNIIKLPMLASLIEAFP